MTIPIISDSHGSGYRAEYIFERLKRCGDHPSAVIFLGDGARDIEDGIPDSCELISVAGNCDAWTSLFDDNGNEIPDERLEIIGGLRIFMTHGHMYGVKGGYGAAVSYACREGADVLLFGHTHIPCQTYDSALPRPLHILNPGSIGYRGDGFYSYGIIEIQAGSVLLSVGKING